eukprot:TRINITY_DN28503_c0_g1_i3.p1 TRINITY_DN28503_c0_g1~~TRINITY_DN28503_c0_g1_i3.p1  ORF type:complete len:161 (+),score=44.03 TRINITY_DN28503_c0_g1_i3:54-536(+)
MGKKTTAIFIALICFVSFSAFAEIEVPYVDIEDAQAKIKTLEDENTKLQAENDKLNQEISEMEGIITEEQKRVNQISLVIAKVQDQSGQLYESYPKIQDAETKKKAQDIIGKNLSLIHISEPTRPLYISYAVFCLKKKNQHPVQYHKSHSANNINKPHIN